MTLSNKFDSLDDLKFLAFTPQLAIHFKTINQQWIEDMFVMEPVDQDILNHPQRLVIDPGGYIWFAKHATLGVIGTCALYRKGQNIFELTKMGVLDEARGLKAGEQLLQHVLNEAKRMKIETLFLLTNTKCQAAIHLYEKNGFVHDQQIMQRYGQAYQRCNVAMSYTPAE
ncbi:MAG: GNAT superfamily N-acetyltransferase [Paraglaciecola sp.]|jgi:GNAT superfamily N-acetyltransferase